MCRKVRERETQRLEVQTTVTKVYKSAFPILSPIWLYSDASMTYACHRKEEIQRLIRCGVNDKEESEQHKIIIQHPFPFSSFHVISFFQTCRVPPTAIGPSDKFVAGVGLRARSRGLQAA